MPVPRAQSPAVVEFAEARDELAQATKAIMEELQHGPRQAEELIRDVVSAQHLDPVVVQKAIIAAVRRGDLVMDQRFTLSVA